jgi:hypothetical protein
LQAAVLLRPAGRSLASRRALPNLAELSTRQAGRSVPLILVKVLRVRCPRCAWRMEATMAAVRDGR